MIYLESPDPKQHIPGKIWLVINSHKWQPHSIGACCRERQLTAALGRDCGCCPWHSSPQCRRSFCSLCGYSSEQHQGRGKPLGSKSRENSIARCRDAWRAKQHRTASFPELFATGFHYSPKDLLAWCFCCPTSHPANLRGSLGCIPQEKNPCKHTPPSSFCQHAWCAAQRRAMCPLRRIILICSVDLGGSHW